MNRENQTSEEWAAEMMEIQERAARARRFQESNPQLSDVSLVDIDKVLEAIKDQES